MKKVTATINMTVKMIAAGLNTSSVGLEAGVVTVTVVAIEFTVAP